MLTSCIITKDISEKQNDFPKTFDDAEIWAEKQFTPVETFITFSSDSIKSRKRTD